MDIPIQTVATDGFEMDYFSFGHGSKTLVILPGLSVQSVMGFAASVEAAYEPLTDDYTVYLFDRRRALPDTYTVRDMARDTAAALEALGLERIDLFGASQGGMIAMVLAADHPALVRHLVLGSTAARVDGARYAGIARWIDLARAGDAEGLYRAFGALVYPDDVFEASRALLDEAARTVTGDELARFVTLAAGIQDFDAADDLRRVACPVLVLAAKDDKVLGPEAGERIAACLGGKAELYTYEGYGHAAYDLAPDYKQRMLCFLRAGT